MRCAGATPYGLRTRALVVLLWRSGLRISEALALAESDLHASTGGIVVRRGKGGKRREVGMDRWAWEHIKPWLDYRAELPIGALLCQGIDHSRASTPVGRGSVPAGELRRVKTPPGVCNKAGICRPCAWLA